MGKLNRRVVLAFGLSVAVACSGTPTVPVVTTTTTTTITGTVTTSAPTLAPLGGVTLTVLDGPAAGKSITTTENGAFAFSTAKGPFTVLADKDGYDDQTLTVDASGPQTLRFTLKPIPREVEEILTPEMGVACSEPCRRAFAIPVHNDGKIFASIVWPAVSAPHLTLWRGETQIPTTTFGHTGSSYFRPEVPVTGGAVYFLRVSGGIGTAPLNFHLSVIRPN